MKVKKYTAQTMSEAMEKVRKELGVKAVILHSKQAKTKGFLGLFRKKYIEIIAAVDPNPINERKSQTYVMRTEKRPNLKNRDGQEKLEEKLLSEIRTLKSDLNSSNIAEHLPKEIHFFEKQLRDNEINEETIKEIIPLLLEKYYSNRSSKSEMYDVIRSYFFERLKDGKFLSITNAKHIFLVGPTGVGKTTTIAKLAAKSAITDGKKVAFITLDTYRIAAIEQLKTYAKILNIPIEVVYHRDDFLKAKEKFKDYDQIFIDTAGRNYRKAEYVQQFQQLVDIDANDIVLSVLSLTSKEQDLDDILEQFNQLNIDGIIFTKADETSQYGLIYNLWKKHNSTFSYITYGQDVPDDIEQLSPELLSKLIVGEQKW